MLFLRSLLFNVLFYLNLVVLMLLGLPTLLFGHRAVLALARTWANSSNWLLRNICGLEAEYRGLQNIPRGGYIIAPKHQSIWETFSLVPFAPDFSYILKRELTWLPFFGWYLVRARQIAINRSRGSSALAEATRKSREVLAEGRQIFIFPEGTRRPVGAPPIYKYGVASIYADANAPCLPVALNAGLFWPRRSFLRRRGKILVEFLEPIPPGLEKSEFLSILKERLEGATNRLIEESIAVDPSLRQIMADANQTTS
jgi:1-acyl-sn-glycerol-3-phosphate acyltransferase